MDWTDEQLAIRHAVRDFADAEIVPVRDELEHGDLEPYGLIRRYLRAFGLDTLAVDRFRSPEAAASARDRAERVNMALLPLIELCRHCPGLTTAMGVSINLAGGTINRQGTPEQRERWALPLLTMEHVGAWAITEPDSGSDAFGGMRASAVRDGDDFVLNGSKTFITNGPAADTIVFICKLVDGSESRRRRIVSFVLDRGMPGLLQGPRMRKMGLHSSPTGEIAAQDVVVGVDRLLGGLAALEPATTDGRGRARQTFASERASVAAMALGIIERCLELSVEYARERVQFGKPIGQRQLIQAKLADMEVARLNVENLVLRYIDRASRGASPSLAEASAMKLYAARSAVQVAMEAVQIYGGNGYMAENHVEQLARDAKAMQIYGGTDELQVVAIARDLLEPQ
jgi:alkylation response protein AidB-like acyl-CoA dehydrogenase